jgi:hypothetical protein
MKSTFLTLSVAAASLLSTCYAEEIKVIMPLLHREIKAVFEEIPQSIFVIKLVGEDRKGRL